MIRSEQADSILSVARPAEPSATDEFRRYWRIVLVAMLGTGFGSLFGYTFGIFAEPLSRAFHASFASVSFWITLYIVTMMVVAPVAGRMADRFGARRVALVCIPLLAASFASCGLLSGGIWTLYLGGVLIGCANPGASNLVYGRAINTWFRQGRGVALGVMSAGIGLGAIVGPLLVQAAIDTWNWRFGFFALGAATLAGFPLVYFWLHEQRECAAREVPAPETGYSRKEAFRLPTFWLMAAGNLLWGLGVGGTNFIVPFLTGKGLSRSQAATYMGLLGATSVLTRVMNGFIVARWPAPYICAGAFLGSAAAFAALGLSWQVGALAPILGLGLILGIQVNCFDYCTARYFGVKAYGEIAGMLGIANGIGMAISTPLFGYLRDVSGAYAVPYLATAAVMLIPAGVMFLLGRHPFLKNT
jgi:predicted MFS family arabinose efflux permease